MLLFAHCRQVAFPRNLLVQQQIDAFKAWAGAPSGKRLVSKKTCLDAMLSLFLTRVLPSDFQKKTSSGDADERPIIRSATLLLLSGRGRELRRCERNQRCSHSFLVTERFPKPNEFNCLLPNLPAVSLRFIHFYRLELILFYAVWRGRKK